MLYNLSSGYGRMMSEKIQLGYTGKFFVVGKSTVANQQIVKELFRPDPEGVKRFYATVDEAVGFCTANAGDTILVLPGHTETVTSTSLTLDVAGVNVVCLGSGSNRPTFTMSAADGTVNVSAANCSWKGGLFVADVDNAAAAFTVGAATDFRLEGASFKDNANNKHFLSIVVTGSTDNAADGLTVVGNYWLGLAVAPNAFISVLGNLDRLLVTDNHVDMAATNDVGHFLTLSSKTVTGTRILRNTLIVVGATTATVGVFLTGSGTSNTGVVAYNLCASLDTTTELIATAGTVLRFFENYYTGTADASGKLWPAVDAA